MNHPKTNLTPEQGKLASELLNGTIKLASVNAIMEMVDAGLDVNEAINVIAHLLIAQAASLAVNGARDSGREPRFDWWQEVCKVRFHHAALPRA